MKLSKYDKEIILIPVRCLPRQLWLSRNAYGKIACLPLWPLGIFMAIVWIIAECLAVITRKT